MAGGKLSLVAMSAGRGGRGPERDSEWQDWSFRWEGVKEKLTNWLVLGPDARVALDGFRK